MNILHLLRGHGVALVLLAALALSSCTSDGPDQLFSDLEAGKAPDDAEVRLKRIMLREPTNMDAPAWLARLKMEDGDFEGAEHYLKTLEEEAPDSATSLEIRCAFDVKKKSWKDARTSCKKALGNSERDPDGLNRLAAAHIVMGDYTSARGLIDETIEKDPDNPEALSNLGYLHLLTQKPQEAVDPLKKALEKKPDLIVARKNLARAYFENFQYPSAAAELETVVKQDPGDHESLFNLAALYAHFLDRPRKAREYLNKARAAGLPPERVVLLQQIIEKSEEQKREREEENKSLPPE